MGKFAESTLRDESLTLPPEVIQYKPISPTATVSLLVGLAAVVAAITAADVGWSFLAVPVLGLALGARGLGSIRRYDMAGKAAARGGLVLSTIALVGGSAAYSYYLKTEVPPDYAKISYEPLQAKGADPIPRDAQALDGKKVYIKGYIYPTADGVRSFVLCRDNGTCCFGGQPKLNDMVEVKLKDPLRLDYTSSLRGVGGTFRVRPEKAAGTLGTVMYHIDDADLLH